MLNMLHMHMRMAQVDLATNAQLFWEGHKNLGFDIYLAFSEKLNFTG